MHSSMIRLALFDIDSTLTLGRCPLMVAAIKSAIAQHMGIAGSPEDIAHDGFTELRTFTDLGLFYGLDRQESQGRARAAIAAKDQILADALAHHSGDLAPISACAGAPEFVAMMRDAGVMLGLVTGNTVLAAHNKLERAGYAPDDFLVGGYGDQSVERADLVRSAVAAARRLLPDLQLEQVWVVGDTPYDTQAALEAGAHALAVTSGGFGVADLRAAGADLVVRSLHPSTALRASLGLGPTQGL
jgi:phosphoglycolate phosphatase